MLRAERPCEETSSGGARDCGLGEDGRAWSLCACTWTALAASDCWRALGRSPAQRSQPWLCTPRFHPGGWDRAGL